MSAGGAFGGARGYQPKPPDKGVFPLDHFGECKQVGPRFYQPALLACTVLYGACLSNLCSDDSMLLSHAGQRGLYGMPQGTRQPGRGLQELGQIILGVQNGEVRLSGSASIPAAGVSYKAFAAPCT